MAALKLISVGNGAGVVLPREMLAKLGLKEGGTLNAVEMPDGIRLTSNYDEFESQMAVARQVMRDHERVPRELAK